VLSSGPVLSGPVLPGRVVPWTVPPGGVLPGRPLRGAGTAGRGLPGAGTEPDAELRSGGLAAGTRVSAGPDGRQDRGRDGAGATSIPASSAAVGLETSLARIAESSEIFIPDVTALV
jgi:hypothetical protein